MRLAKRQLSGKANCYDTPFSTSFYTDIDLVLIIVEKAIFKHPGILDKPYLPEYELCEFDDDSFDFAVEFWGNGIEDGKHKYTFYILFLI